MRKINSRTIIAICTLVLALVWLFLGIFKYGIWDAAGGQPKPGLFPVGISIILAVVSIIGIGKSFKEESAAYKKPALVVMASLILLVVASFTIGILPSLLIYYVLWQLLVEKTPKKTLVLSTLVVSAIVLGVFVFWLKVPFEKGILYDLIMY